MPSVRGRLPTGPKGVLEVSDEVVRVKRETGFLSKTLKTHKELPVSEAVSTELEKSHPRNKKIQRLTIRFLGDDGEEEIVFLSEDGPSLQAVRTEIDEDIERRELVRELERAVMARLMETHVHQITLVIELIDQIFLTIFGLDGHVDWKLMGEYVNRSEQVTREMGDLEVDPKLSYEIDDLEAAVRLRKIDEIKSQCYGILEAIHRDVETLVDGHSEEFNFELYEWFIHAVTLLWDLRLGEHLGDAPDEREVEELQIYLGNMDDLVSIYEDPEASGLIERLQEERVNDSVFKAVRSIIHQSLNSLIKAAGLERPPS